MVSRKQARKFDCKFMDGPRVILTTPLQGERGLCVYDVLAASSRQDGGRHHRRAGQQAQPGRSGENGT